MCQSLRDSHCRANKQTSQFYLQGYSRNALRQVVLAASPVARRLGSPWHGAQSCPLDKVASPYFATQIARTRFRE